MPAPILTPNFPGAVSQDLYNLTNIFPGLVAPTLAAPIAAGDLAATLSADPGTLMPTAYFEISIDSEIIVVSARAGAALTLATRGFDGTTAAAHALGATVTAFPTAHHMNRLAAEIYALENTLQPQLAAVLRPDTYPPAPNTMDDEFLAAALDPKWSWVNQGPATAPLAASRVILQMPAQNTTNLRLIVQALPATPWEFTAQLEPYFDNSDYAAAGLALYESATGKILVWWTGNGIPLRRQVLGYTNTTTYGGYAPYNYQPAIYALGAPIYRKISGDGTNLTFSESTNENAFIAYLTAAKNAFLTTAPDKIGLIIHTQNNLPISLACDWFRRTA
jgi:hypothetical protein